MLPTADCEHTPGRWEVDEVKKHFTRRCARCGDILERSTFDEAAGSKVSAIKNYLNRWLVMEQPTKRGGR